jgi:hypothetical protein
MARLLVTCKRFYNVVRGQGLQSMGTMFGKAYGQGGHRHDGGQVRTGIHSLCNTATSTCLGGLFIRHALCAGGFAPISRGCRKGAFLQRP